MKTPSHGFINHFAVAMVHHQLIFWMNSGRQTSKLHFDPHDALLTQIAGQKAAQSVACCYCYILDRRARPTSNPPLAEAQAESLHLRPQRIPGMSAWVPLVLPPQDVIMSPPASLADLYADFPRDRPSRVDTQNVSLSRCPYVDDCLAA